MILKIKSVEISNVRDIGEKQRVTFKNSGIYSVTGVNEDDGGSNGTGKTSFVMSVAVGFFGTKVVDITNEEIKNRHSEGKANIKLHATVDDEDLFIERTIGGRVKLKFKTPDFVEGSAVDMQSKINDAIKITPEQFLALSYKKQGDGGGFLLLTDSKKKEFLSSFFDLSAIEKAQEKVDGKFEQIKNSLTAISAQVAEKTSSISALESEVNRHREALARLSTPETKANLERYTFESKILQVKIQELTEAINTPSPEVKGAYDSFNRYDEAYSIAQAELFTQNNYQTQVQVLKARMMEKEKTLSTPKGKKCVSCDQNINDGTAEAQCAAIHRELKKIESEIDNLVKKINPELPNQVVALQKLRDQKSIILAEVKHQNSKHVLEASLQSTRQSLSNVDSLIRSEKKQVEVAEHELKWSIIKHDGCLADIKTLSGQYETLKTDCVITTALSKVLSKSGFVGYIFDTILEELNYETNNNLKMIPNASKFTLGFSSDKVTKTTNNVSKSITFKLWNSDSVISLESLSGGERRSLIIAVDEALDSVLSRRTGVKVNWKFLDEPFDAIDINSKEALLEFYRNKSNDRLYFIIDHASELNAGLDHSIKLTKKNGIATIAC